MVPGLLHFWGDARPFKNLQKKGHTSLVGEAGLLNPLFEAATVAGERECIVMASACESCSF